MVLGTWYLVLGTWYLVHDTWYIVHYLALYNNRNRKTQQTNNEPSANA
jgi:hypothetical protein